MYSIIPCTELNGSRSEQFGIPASGTTTVRLKCAWADSINLVGDILDNRRSDPLHPGLFARTATVTGHGGESGGYTGAGQVIIPDEAVVTITYGSLTAEELDTPSVAVSGDPNAEIMTETLEPTLEFMTLDHRKFQWGAGEGGTKLVPDEAPGRLLPGMKLVRNWKRVQTLPIQLLTLMGHVNATPYVSSRLNLTFDTETLLYMPPVMSRSIVQSGALAWNLTLSFSYKPWTWNKFWNSTNQTYERMYLLNTSTPYNNYPLGNIGPLVSG